MTPILPKSRNQDSKQLFRIRVTKIFKINVDLNSNVIEKIVTQILNNRYSP